MRFQFHVGLPCQLRHRREARLSQALRQGKEIVGRPVTSYNPLIQRSPIKPVHEALFGNRETEGASNPLSPRNGSRHQHVRAEMEMLMPIEMGGRLPVQPNELVKLTLEHRAEAAT